MPIYFFFFNNLLSISIFIKIIVQIYLTLEFKLCLYLINKGTHIVLTIILISIECYQNYNLEKFTIYWVGQKVCLANKQDPDGILCSFS